MSKWWTTVDSKSCPCSLLDLLSNHSLCLQQSHRFTRQPSCRTLANSFCLSSAALPPKSRAASLIACLKQLLLGCTFLSLSWKKRNWGQGEGCWELFTWVMEEGGKRSGLPMPLWAQEGIFPTEVGTMWVGPRNPHVLFLCAE